MLNIDEFVKLLLAGAFSFAIVIIAWYVARFLAAVTANLKEIRELINVVHRLSDQTMEDYMNVRGSVKKLFGIFELPVVLKGLFGAFNRYNKPKRRDREDNEEE